MYAVAKDFCRIFTNEMTGLYVLAFLLAGNQAMAEQIYLGALETCRRANAVFKDWAHAWARRSIIQAAIEAVHPAPNVAREVSLVPAMSTNVPAPENGTALPAILGLSEFERFVYVLTVLERYTDQDCRSLLACSRQDVVLARNRALERVASWSAAGLPQAAPQQRHLLAQAS